MEEVVEKERVVEKACRRVGLMECAGAVCCSEYYLFLVAWIVSLVLV